MSANDALLGEYLRVINDKDERIHQLLVDIEKLQLSQKRKDDNHKRHLKEIEGVIDSLKTSVKRDQSQEAEISSLRRKNQDLLRDVERLNEAFKKSEVEMANIAKDQAKWKRHETHAKEKAQRQFDSERKELEKRLYDSASKMALLETQVDSLQGNREVGDKDALRWKVEAQRLSEELADASNANRELKRRSKDMIPALSHESALAQAETKHQSIVHALDAQIASLQREVRDERSRLNTTEIRLREAECKVNELSSQNTQLRDSVAGKSSEVAEVRLEKQQMLLEQKESSEQNIKLLQQQLDRYYTENVSLDGELRIQKLRVSDLEAAASLAADRFRRDEVQLTAIVTSLKQELADAKGELDAVSRQAEQSRVMLERSTCQASGLTTELQIAHNENARLAKVQDQLIAVKRAGEEQHMQLQSLESNLRGKDNSISDMREENAQLRRDFAALTAARDRLVKDHSDRVDKLHAQVRDRDEQIEELNSKLRVTAANEASATSTVSILESKADKLKQLLRERDATEGLLRRDIDRLSEELDAAQSTLQQVQTDKAALERDIEAMHKSRQNLVDQLQDSHREMEEVNSKVRQVERSAADHEEELTRQLESARTRSQGLARELHNTQQALNLAKIEGSRSESTFSELSSKFQSLTSELEDRVERVATLEGQLKDARAESELSSRAQRVDADRMMSANRDLETQVLTARDEYGRRVKSLEDQIVNLADELRRSRERDADQATELLKRRSEVATWQERCANLESLKRISDTQVEDFQRRERDLMEKIDLLQESQQEMQVLFERQHQQVDMGRRLREERS